LPSTVGNPPDSTGGNGSSGSTDNGGNGNSGNSTGGNGSGGSGGSTDNQGDVPNDTPPIAVAGDDLTANEGDVIQLDASQSSDPDGDSLTFSWSVDPSGYDVVLDDPTSPTPSFTAPDVTEDTVLHFTVTVSDGQESSSDEIDIHVVANVMQQPTPPVANAGVDQEVTAGDTITLDGSTGAADAGSQVTYQWEEVSGDPVSIPNATSATLSFSAPAVSSDSTLVFKLIVSRDGLSSSDQVAVIVHPLQSGAPPSLPPPVDNCPNDPNKTEPGICGCGVPDTDSDGDGTPDCIDGCPNDPTKTNAADCPDPALDRDTDWELYMLRLVNRARLDPSGEAARIGSSVTDNHAPVQPLAYDLLLGQSAENHDHWMFDNFGGISSGQAPDSFTHFETLNGQSSGTAATGTPSYTGAGVGDRFTYVGYSWNSYGENIQTNYSTTSLPVNKARIDAAHKGWWESSGHRANMLYGSYTSFGFHAESRTFTPPRGGLSAPFDNLFYTTQDYGTPQPTPRNCVFGVVYVDHDSDGVWTPRDVGNPLREGVSGATVEVVTSGTATVIATTTTMGNGAFSARVANGTYDAIVHSSLISGGQTAIHGIVISGANADAGDLSIH